MQAFTVADFSGGWNTAQDETVIPANMSASMMNFDVLDSGTLRRRNGYSVSYQPVSATIWGFGWLYAANGNEYAAVISGTNMATCQMGVANIPAATSEAEGLTGTHAVYSHPWFSGNSAVSLTATVTATFDIPSSTSISMTFRGNVDASIKVDSGSYVTVHATNDTSYTFSSLSATAHHVYVKPHDPVESSLKHSVTGIDEYVYSTRDLPTLSDGIHVIHASFYDLYTTATKAAGRYIQIGTSSTAKYLRVGCDYSISNTMYFANFGGTNVSFSQVRTTGWHDVSIELNVSGGTTTITSVTLDLKTIQRNMVVTADVIRCVTFSRSSADRTAYYDDIRLDDKQFEHFTSYSLWTTVSSSATYSAAVSSEQHQSNVRFLVDTFTYSTPSSWTHLDTSISATEQVYGFAQLNNSLYYGSKHDRVRGFNGTSVSGTVTGTASYGGFIVEAKRRLFASGGFSDPSLIEYTDTDEPTDWRGGGSVRLSGQDSGQGCTGLAFWNGVIWWASESSLFAFDISDASPTNWAARRVSNVHGCVARRTMCAAENGIIFLSADGVRTYGLVSGMNSSDGSVLQLISKNIAPSLKGIADWDLPCAAVYDGKYWLSVPLDGAATNTHVLVCDLKKKNKDGQPVWVPYNIAGVTCFSVYSRDGEYILYGGTSSGGIVQIGTGDTDAGDSIAAHYTIPPVTPDGYQTVKHWKHAHLSLESDSSQTIIVAPSTDDVAGSAVSAVVSEASDSQPVRLLIPARGRYMKLDIASNAAAPLTVNAVTFTYSPRPRMR